MKRNRILAVLSVLANCDRAKYPLGMSRGEIRAAAGLSPDTEATRPLRDLRKVPYELNVITTETSENGERVWRYRLHVNDIERARTFLPSKLTAAQEPTSAPIGSAKCQTARHDLMPRVQATCNIGLVKHIRCWECGRCYTCSEASIGDAAVSS